MKLQKSAIYSHFRILLKTTKMLGINSIPVRVTLSILQNRYFTKNPRFFGNVIKLTENDKEAGVCLYVSERTPAITYTKMT